MPRWLVLGFVVALCCLLAPRPAHAGEDAKVKKLITELLENKDVKKRRLALLDLEIVGARIKGVLPALQAALEKDPEPIVRQEVAAALGRMREDARDAIPALAASLHNDKDDKTREQAARALLQMVPYSKRALEQMVEALQDSYAPTRAAVAEAIKALGEQSKGAVPQMVDFLKSGKDKKADAVARMHIALALGRVGPDGAKGTDVLGAVLLDTAEDNAVREAAADSLGRLGLDAVGAAKPLAEVVKSTKNPRSLRLAAVKALAKVEGDGKEVWPALKVSLGDSDATIRLLAIRAATPYAAEQPEVVEMFIKIARSTENVEVRLAAIQELGMAGTAAKTALPDLRFLIENDERESIRMEAQQALKKIKSQ
jgi:HEAT repeat protein